MVTFHMPYMTVSNDQSSIIIAIGNQVAVNCLIGMSFISMVSMEISMNATDYFLTGGAMLTWWVVPIMLTVGFLTPWPYNYWRLKKFNQACH